MVMSIQILSIPIYIDSSINMMVTVGKINQKQVVKLGVRGKKNEAIS